MTTRQQILRSSTPGQTPAAGSRLPGELWTTFPDLQLGVIDASRNAQRLVAVRYFSAAANYAAGDFVIQAGVLYVAKGAITAGAFNVSQWTKVAAATDAGGPYLAIAGGTLTGDLILNRDPQVALGSATKQYVDGKVTAAPFLPIAGGTLAGLLTLSGPPTVPLHAATKAYVDAGAFVPIGGGTMTGDLILNRNPQVALGAVPKQYVDALPAAMNDNRIINGDMRIDQRNNGASGTAFGYTVDRWQFSATLATKGTWGQNLGSLSLPSGFPYYLGFTSNSAYAVVAGDYFTFVQMIEADAVSDFAWGTANAQPVALSFWARSSKTGTFGGSITNYTGTRSYPFTYSLPSANTPTFIIITIPGDTVGAWVMSGNSGSVNVYFGLGVGATFSHAAGAWAAGNYVSSTGAVSVVATNAATFNLTGIKLEIGSVATPYNRQSLAKSMADCQRYYQVGQVASQGYGIATAQYYASQPYQIFMRAAPTLVVGANNSSNIGAPSFAQLAPGGFGLTVLGTVTTTGTYSLNVNYTASAEI